MVRQRTSTREPRSWNDPSQTFADTQRVDLFNDPRWEAPGRSSTRGGPAARSPEAGWVGARLAAVRRALGERGQHSRR
jgi:hypothetical protein